jgi:chromosome segregation ATPase
MKPTPSALALSLLACLLTSLPAHAQDERAAERAARRQQMQMQQLQQQVSQAEAEKARLQQERDQAEKQAEKQAGERARALARASAAEKAALERARLLDEEKAALQQRIEALEQAAKAQQQEAAAALAAKDAELARTAAALQAQTGAREEWQQRFGQQVRLVTECSEKNERLVKLGAELLARWQGKGVMDALKQREPLLGLGDVQMFNLVQAYRDKTDNEKFVPRVERE